MKEYSTYKVTTSKGESYLTFCKDWNAAMAGACKAFNCPERAIVKIELIKYQG